MNVTVGELTKTLPYTINIAPITRHARTLGKVSCLCGFQHARITLFSAVVYSVCPQISSCPYRETSIKQGVQDLSLGQC